jgi:hypothetical protein
VQDRPFDQYHDAAHRQIDQPARSRIHPVGADENVAKRRLPSQSCDCGWRLASCRGVRRGRRRWLCYRGRKRIGIHRCLGHGKTLGLSFLRRFLDPGSVGTPQFIAAALLLVYLLECAWLVVIETRQALLPDSNHALCIYEGLEQWKGGAIAGTPQSLRSEAATGMPSAGHAGHLRVRDGYDQDRSPLYYLIAAAPLLVRPAALPPDSPIGQLGIAMPYLFFGVMLGGSLWYVCRRLYGNAGGYIALGFYCFSPAMIVGTAGAQSFFEIGAVWGAFGTVWTGIAVAHTLYAPREVVLWNWRRILLLGLSLVLAVGDEFSLMVVVLVALLLMLWVAPIRKRAVIAIWASACALAAALLFASYSAKPRFFVAGMKHAQWFDFQPRALATSLSYSHIFHELLRGAPPLMIAFPAALIAYFSWKRARYFGNTAPLLIAGLLLILALAAPTFPGQGFQLSALVFLFVFVAGVFADLLETRHGLIVTASVSSLLSASAIWNLLQLARLARR